MSEPNEVTSPKQISSKPEKRRAEALHVDVSAINDMPDAQCEAALGVALDRIMEMSKKDPLQGLASVIELMQQVNIEIYKCYAPTAMQAAQNTAIVAQNPQGGPSAPGLTPNATKDQVRTIGAMSELQEAIVKMGVARVKTHDEIERRRDRDAVG